MDPAAAASPAWKSALVFATCTLIWGTTFLFIRIGNDTMPPLWAAALRLLLASAILFVIGTLTRQPLPRGAALRGAAWYGLFTFGINLPLLYWGETAVPSSVSAILFATVPLTSALLAWRVGLESFSPARLIGAVIAAAGIATIFWGEQRTQLSPWPMAAVMLATLAAVLGTIIYKRAPHQAAVPANTVATLIGGVLCLGYSLIAHERMALPTTSSAWVALLYLTIGGSVGAFVLWTWLVSRWPVSRLSFIAVITPLIALTLGALVRGERLAGSSLVGAAIVLVGVVVGLQIGRSTPHGNPARRT